MEEKNKLLRELLFGSTIEDLRTLVNFKRQTKKPKSTVKRMVDYFKEKPIPLAPQANITEVRRAMKGYSRGFKINIVNDRDPLVQLQETRQEIGRFLKRLKVEMGGFKYSEALEVEFFKRIECPKPHKYEEGYCVSKQRIVINTHSIQESLELSQQEALAKIANWMSEASGWVVSQVRRHYINIAKHNPLKGSSYRELQPELRNSKYGLINFKNDDNQCFRWCHIRRFNQQRKDPTADQKVRQIDG